MANTTVDAIYEVVQDAWIEGCRYGSGIKEPGPAELEVLLRRLEGLVRELLGQAQPPK